MLPCEDGTSMAVTEGLVDDMKNCGYITILQKIDECEVCVDFRAFRGNKTLKSVTIGDGSYDAEYIMICYEAFAECTSLKDVIIDSSANCFWGGKDIFKGCKSLSKESKAALRAAGYKGKF